MTESDIEFMVKRLRVVVALLGLTDDVPINDKDVAGCAGTVLGMIARHIEYLQAENAQLKADFEKYIQRGV